MANKVIALRYPVFGVAATEDGWLICGGGGGSRSGVHNTITRFAADGASVRQVQTDAGAGAPTCVAYCKQHVACGVDDQCVVYSTDFKEITRQQTDHHVGKSAYDESYQKVCRFNQDGDMIATGGTDSVVRLWQWNGEFKLFHSLEKHTADISSVSFAYVEAASDVERRASVSGLSELHQIVCSAAADSVCVWNCDDGKMLYDMAATSGQKFKFAEFVPASGTSKYIVAVSLDSKRHSLISIYRTTAAGMSLMKSVALSDRPVTAFAVSQSHVACGTSDGDVMLIDAHSLQVLARVKNAHGFSVTAIAIGTHKVDNRDKEVVKVCSGSADYSVNVWSIDEMVKRHGVSQLNWTLIMTVLVALLAILYALTQFK